MTKHSTFLYTSELNNAILLSFKSLENSNFSVRNCVSKLIGNLLFYALSTDELIKNSTQQSNQLSNSIQNNDVIMEKKIESAFQLLSNGFIKNKTRFLKVNKKDESRNTLQTNREEVRIGVTYAYIEFIKLLGSSLLDKYITMYISSVLELVKNFKASNNNDFEIITLRKCVNYILRSTIGLMLNENSQITAAKEMIFLIKKYIQNGMYLVFLFISTFERGIVSTVRL